MRTGPLHVAEDGGTVCAMPPKHRQLVLWKSRCTERILIVRDPRRFQKEALMRCLQEGPS
jgi:hypothetical protein